MSEFRPRNRRTLMGSTISNASITGDFRNGLAYNSKFDAVIFTSCQMDRMSLFGSTFEDCTFSGCTLTGANLNSCRFDNTSFYECNMDMASFDTSIFTNSLITGGRAEYASFRDAAFHGCRVKTQLHGADFRVAKGDGLNLGGSNTWGLSLNASCSSFIGVQYDQRQLELFLALLSKSQGNDEFKSKIAGLVSEHMMKVAERLILSTEEA